MTTDFDMLDPISCVVCSGEAMPQGTLGEKTYFRCEDCGIKFTVEAWTGKIELDIGDHHEIQD
jgi:hypothetical protein